MSKNSFRTLTSTYVVQQETEGGTTAGTYMLPRLGNRCANPPCVPMCPVGAATFKRHDGIIVVDGDRCVGCAYCVQACPYDARFINRETNKGDKCTFCAHRVDTGLLPAFVETCVGGARRAPKPTDHPCCPCENGRPGAKGGAREVP